MQLSLKLKRNVISESEIRKIHKIVWDTAKSDCFRNSLSDSLIGLDLLVDRMINGNLNIDDGVENFGAVLYNNANRVFGKNIMVKTGQSCSSRKYNSLVQ